MQHGYLDRAMQALPRQAHGDPRRVGTVVHWVVGRGYGFIQPDGGGEDIFVHVRCIEGQQPLTMGERVSFAMGTNPRTARPEAKNVVVMED